MAIPAGSIDYSLPILHLGPHNHVFEDLVDRMPDVEGSISIGWAIMENKRVVFRSIGRLPLIKAIRAISQMLSLQLRVRASSVLQVNSNSMCRIGCSETHGKLERGSFKVDFHDFNMFESKPCRMVDSRSQWADRGRSGR